MVTKERFTYFIEEHKLENNFNTYIETIIDIIEQRFFPEIDHDNIKKFLTKITYDKLKVEYSEYGFMKDEHKTVKNNLW